MIRLNYPQAIKHLLLTAGLMGCFIGTSFGQNNCKDALYESNKLFEAGKIQECIQRLRPCVGSFKDKSKLQNSYHLLAQAYQTNDQLDSAKYFVEKLLLINPYYQKFPNIDPLDFNRLVNQYRVDERLYLGLKVGVTNAGVKLNQSYALYASPQTYNTVTGYALGFTADYMLKPDWSAQAEVLGIGTGIEHRIENAGGWEKNYFEQNNFISFNLGIKKHFKITQKLNTNFGIGLGLNYLQNSNIYLETTLNQTKLQVTKDPIKERNRIQTSLNMGAGLSYKLPHGLIGLNISYAHFLTNTVKAQERTVDQDFIFNNQYINDDIQLRILGINLSYKMPILWKVKLKK